MATSPDPKNTGPDAKKPAATSRLAEVQKRAERLASRKPVSAKQFLNEAMVELKKTTWPTREVLIKSTTVVLALVVSVGLFMGTLDIVLTKLTNPLFSGR
jgi:preprotein translocase SecE subunit